MATESTVPCPTQSQVHDGGKWTCGLIEVGRAARRQGSGCVVYSFGSNNDDTFERQVANLTEGACATHVFDPTSAPVTGRWITGFHALGLGPEKTMREGIGALTTLGDITKQLGHKAIDVLKVDVEGGEFEAFADIDWDTFPARVGQILVEVHPAQCTIMSKATCVSLLINKLEKHGYVF